MYWKLTALPKTFRWLLLILFTAAVALQVSCQSSDEKKTFTVGIVNFSREFDDIIEGFMNGLDSRFVACNISVEYLYREPIKNDTELRTLISQFMNEDVDMIFTLSTPATKKTISFLGDSDIPIIFTPVYDPVQAGIIKHLVHHEKNVTGVKIGGSIEKALEYLLKIHPSIKKILAPVHIKNMPSVQSLMQLRKAADIFGVEVIAPEVGNRKELLASLDDLPPGCDALWLLHSHLLVSNVDRYVQATLQNKLPLATATDRYKAGALLSYGPDSSRIGKQVSHLAYQIYQGASARELPIETSDFFLGINMSTARQINAEIPLDILSIADFVIPAGPETP